MMRRLLTFSITAVAATTAWVVGAGPALAYPPDPPPASTAQSQLASLTVQAEGSSTGYRQDKFPHWHTVSGTCDTRDEVLKRGAPQKVPTAAPHRPLGRRSAFR